MDKLRTKKQKIERKVAGKRLRQCARRFFLLGAIVTLLIIGIGIGVWTSISKEESYQTFTLSDMETNFATSPHENANADPEAEELLILVNWDNPVPYDRPDDLVTLDEIFNDEVALTNSEGSVNKEAGQAAKAMFSDALAQGIGRYKITSAYRSITYQDQLWNARREQDPTYGDDPYNKPVKVMPGNRSEHTTGLAIDILSEAHEQADDEFADTQEGQWLAENAHKYGFILRYPKDKEHITGVIFEPWHYRYVGVDAATEMYEKNLCLEEYLLDL